MKPGEKKVIGEWEVEKLRGRFFGTSHRYSVKHVKTGFSFSAYYGRTRIHDKNGQWNTSRMDPIPNWENSEAKRYIESMRALE